MSRVHKYRLLKDLPEYPKDTVFVLNETGWRAYWRGGDFTIPKWLEELLYNIVPDVNDEMHDWFEQIVDDEQKVYVLDILGNIKEETVYNFWVNTHAPYVFSDRATAEEKAKKLKELLETTNDI